MSELSQTLCRQLNSARIPCRVDSTLYPNRREVLNNALLRITPGPISRLINAFPSRQHDTLSNFFNLAVKVVQTIISEKRKETIQKVDKDALSVLRKFPSLLRDA